MIRANREVMRTGIGLVRETRPPASQWQSCAALKSFPANGVRSSHELDETLTAEVTTQWHLSGTARMGGATDLKAVVDHHGRVHGLDGLRVADASIMPTVTNGNTNSPTMMIAEKLSDAILVKAPLPRDTAEVWINPNHDSSQR